MPDNISHQQPSPVILWFRSDLRLFDHDGVNMALAMGRPIIPLLIFDEDAGTRPLGSRSRWWLHHSLNVLHENLASRQSRLIIKAGTCREILLRLVEETGANTIISSHTFDPRTEDIDRGLKAALSASGIAYNQHNTTLLVPPDTLKTAEGRPYRVFTPYFRALSAAGACDIDALPPRTTEPWPAPRAWPRSLGLDELDLTRSGDADLVQMEAPVPGELGALKALERFIDTRLAGYAEGRDYPDRQVTSGLAAHLRFGEISPKRILHDINKAVAGKPDPTGSAAKFRSELAWREFSYGLLSQKPDLHRENFKPDFDHFPWRDDDAGFEAWCRGETGYDLVDAGMRELAQTGTMHNRVRMVCASFLCKHLLIDWRRGEAWFWDRLFDADPANNPASWQWVAGCGADAAPYFRIFNPMTQAAKFDPSGHYRQRFLPPSARTKSIRKAPDLFDTKDMFAPSLYSDAPIVNHEFARHRALEAYKNRIPA